MLQVSVVIPTRSREGQVLRSVDRLLPDSLVGEILVVVDGGARSSHALLEARAREEPRLRAVWQPHAGAGAARQRGVELARHEIVLLLDDDVLPSPSLAAGHARVHEEHRGPVVVVGSMPTTVPQRRRRHTVTTDLYVSDYEACTRDWLADPDTVLQHLWMGNISLPRKQALRVGIDDPVMGALFFEDLDLGQRLRRAGLTAVFRPELAATHEHERSLQRFLDDSRRQGRALVVLHERYPDTVPEPTPRTIAGRAPLPARLLVQAASTGGVVAQGICWTVLWSCQAAGVLRAWRLQRYLTILLRRVGQAAGRTEQPGAR